ncbi:MAG TPA: MFS transporter [Thermoanaerobaculia bacterium]|jgi:predicted MFS family arabinose efflux permease
MSRRLVFLLAFAGGATVANLYYSQPLLAMIAAELNVRSAAVSFVSTATQLGYAAGLLLLVPLGDVVERRRLIVTTTACIVAALLLVAASQSLPWLIVSSILLGAATIVPQIIIPFAAHLARDEERGRIIGTVMSGLLIGIILSRSVSGVLASIAGWRATYLLAAGGMALLAIVLRLALPLEPPDVVLRYRELLRSMGGVVRSQPVLRRHSLIGACGFAAFTIFWTALAFHLHDLSPAYGTATVGAFGIVGVAGALTAPIAGRVAERFGPRVMNGSGLAMIVLAFAVMFLGSRSLIALGAGVILLDAGQQASHISNQTRIFGLDASLRNRLNAIYMVTFFCGGAIGSLVAGYAWEHGGWWAVCASGAACALAGMAVLFGYAPSHDRTE